MVTCVEVNIGYVHCQNGARGDYWLIGDKFRVIIRNHWCLELGVFGLDIFEEILSFSLLQLIQENTRNKVRTWHTQASTYIHTKEIMGTTWSNS